MKSILTGLLIALVVVTAFTVITTTQVVWTDLKQSRTDLTQAQQEIIEQDILIRAQQACIKDLRGTIDWCKRNMK